MPGEQEVWVMPRWMEPYRESFSNTGGNMIEELMNDRTTSSFDNVLRYALIVSVEAQVQLLSRLHSRGLLVPGSVSP